MNGDNQVLQEDFERLCASEWIPWEQFRDKTFFITGATGLIGSSVVNALRYYNEKHQFRMKFILLVRNSQKAARQFANSASGANDIQFVHGTVEHLPAVEPDVDYVVHCACPTDSAFFVSNPVETIQSILMGTMNVLELARQKNVSGMVYLSSMEVYGHIKTRTALTEQDLGYLDPLSARSSYPEGKRLAENLCAAYANQYNVPVSIARLAQSFGPGVSYQDKRVFAYMARCVLNGEDIVLNTDGSKENMYVYTMDAVSALLLLLVKGAHAQAYNVANEKTYCSVKEMGETVISVLGDSDLKVQTNAGGDSSLYRPDGYLKLSTAKLEALGWVAEANLPEMYTRMVQTFAKE